MIRLRPGSSVPWKRPSRSITHALCCGTMRTPSTTKAMATPMSRIQNQYADSAGTIEAATAAATAAASFQNIFPPLCGTVLRDFERVAIGGEHVHGGARLQRLCTLDARLPARPAIAHPREPRRGIDPAFEACRHAGVD